MILLSVLVAEQRFSGDTRSASSGAPVREGRACPSGRRRQAPARPFAGSNRPSHELLRPDRGVTVRRVNLAERAPAPSGGRVEPGGCMTSLVEKIAAHHNQSEYLEQYWTGSFED